MLFRSQLLPELRLEGDLLAKADQLARVHCGVDAVAVGAPDLVERLVDELQEAIRAEDGHPLGQPVQRPPAPVDRVAVAERNSVVAGKRGQKRVRPGGVRAMKKKK